MISVLVDHVFQLVVVVVDDVVVVVVVTVVQHGAVPLGVAVLFQVFPVRFRFKPEHFHLVRIHDENTPVTRTYIACTVGGQRFGTTVVSTETGGVDRDNDGVCGETCGTARRVCRGRIDADRQTGRIRERTALTGVWQRHGGGCGGYIR